MESDVTQSALFYKLWAWGDKNRKQLLYGLIALIVVGIIAALWLTHEHEKQKEANGALAAITGQTVVTPTAAPAPDAFLKVNADYPNTDAGQRALLLAAGGFYESGKYDLALAQFSKFLTDHNNSPLAGQAALGRAACFEAMGKTDDAVSGYESVVQRYSNQNVEPQARMRLGRLQEGQGKYREARSSYEDIARKFSGTLLASEAILRLQELNVTHPEVQAPAPTPAATPNASTLTAPKTPVAPAAATAPATNLPAK